MGCGCKNKKEKVSSDVSTAIVMQMIDIVKSVPLYNMKNVQTGNVSDSEWHALLFVIYQLAMFVQFNIIEKGKEFISLGGCILCYDSVINGLKDAEIIQQNEDDNIVFLVKRL